MGDLVSIGGFYALFLSVFLSVMVGGVFVGLGWARAVFWGGWGTDTVFSRLEPFYP